MWSDKLNDILGYGMVEVQLEEERGGGSYLEITNSMGIQVPLSIPSCN